VSLLLAAAGLALSLAWAARAADADKQPDVVDGANGVVKVLDGPPTALAFKSVTVDELIPFIVSATGKVVLPQQDVLSRKITVLNETPIPRQQALEMVFLALQQNGIAVVVRGETITLRDIAEVTRQDVPVLGPEITVADRTDLGSIVEKVYTLRFVTAKKFGDAIKSAMPEYAKISLDEESNQIAVLGSIALQKRVESLIKGLDRPAAGSLVTETFKLRYADATNIAQNINDLFNQANARRNENQNQNRRFNFGGGGGDQQSAASPGEIRVSANTQQNAVTVVADPTTIKEIRDQIQQFWDLPLPEEAVVPKIYELRNSDPVKVRDLLEGLFGRATPTRQQGTQQGQQGQPQASTGASQGIGRLAGQFSFQAIPEAGRLVVVAKSPDNLAVVDKIIEGLDQPQTIGLPTIVELKHANAEDLAEQLNTLLAQDGTLAALRRSESGLSQNSTSGASPFATNTTTNTNTNNNDDTSNTRIDFWWQRASRGNTDQRTASNLVGKLRIVPVWRQNALMVVAPPEYKNSVVELVSMLDRPGRQVLLSAIVCEISRDDATQLGLRWSGQTLTPSSADNSIAIGNAFQGTANNNFAGNLFDTTVLNTNINLNLLLQALSEKTAVNILSEPKIFTSDNQEAEFFDGQDIPFITDSQTNTQGNLVQSFDYKAVGIQLRIRPRITLKKDVDLRVNLELSSIVPGQTLFGGFVVDRRETTTQLIVGNQQTIVISGILRTEDSDIVRKIPLLGDIPLLGELFKSRDKKKSTTELLVFITPLVVENPDETNALNAPFRERLNQRRGELEEDSLQREPINPTPAPTPTP
jgi:general secretion pathway protein D